MRLDPRQSRSILRVRQFLQEGGGGGETSLTGCQRSWTSPFDFKVVAGEWTIEGKQMGGNAHFVIIQEQTSDRKGRRRLKGRGLYQRSPRSENALCGIFHDKTKKRKEVYLPKRNKDRFFFAFF